MQELSDRPERTDFGSTLLRSAPRSGLEIVGAVGLATAAVAALQSTAPAAGLGIVYLLAVLTVAIRRGQVPALITAVLSVLTLNYLFITPRHRFEIAHSQDVVELTVLLIAAVVVARLAALARRRAAEAEHRAHLAAAREREAELLADTSAAILAGQSLDAQLQSMGERVALATGARSARVELGALASPREAEVSVALHTRSGNAWLYLRHDDSLDHTLIERLAGPLGSLVDVAVERERIAERAAETEAARRAEIAKTAILHAISHDLRSPLTAITTAASALRAPSVTDAERMELIEAIEGEGARLARLVEDLLDLSKIEAGALAPQPDWCDLHDVVSSAARRFAANHRIEFSLPPNLPLVRADAAQLERVFSNLIENAIKFSPPGSPVEVRGRASNQTVTVRVIDHGPGVVREDRQRIFEPFFRGRAGSASGSGLGLAICRGFVEANGGRLILQTGPDQGTSFAVTLPTAPQPGAAREPPAAPGQVGAERSASPAAVLGGQP